MIRLKRVYEAPLPDDGQRILVERLWPRGVTKEKAAIDLWMKEIAPSTELRKWFHHSPDRWEEFRHRYIAELKERPDLLSELKHHMQSGPVTLIFSARDEDRNSAVELKEFIGGQSD